VDVRKDPDGRAIVPEALLSYLVRTPIALTRIRLTAEGKVRYEADPLVCVKCGSTMSIIACINEVRVIVKILDHLE